MPTIKLKAFTLLERVRTQSPVIHHLTNWVTIYDCAQVVKVLGASPVMAHAPEEVAEMASLPPPWSSTSAPRRWSWSRP